MDCNKVVEPLEFVVSAAGELFARYRILLSTILFLNEQLTTYSEFGNHERNSLPALSVCKYYQPRHIIPGCNFYDVDGL